MHLHTHAHIYSRTHAHTHIRTHTSSDGRRDSKRTFTNSSTPARAHTHTSAGARAHPHTHTFHRVRVWVCVCASTCLHSLLHCSFLAPRAYKKTPHITHFTPPSHVPGILRCTAYACCSEGICVHGRPPYTHILVRWCTHDRTYIDLRIMYTYGYSHTTRTWHFLRTNMGLVALSDIFQVEYTAIRFQITV